MEHKLRILRSAPSGERCAPAANPVTSMPLTPRKKVTTKEYAITAVTARNAEASPLLRLPAELRNRIWEYAFGHKSILCKLPDEMGSLEYFECPDIFEDHSSYGDVVPRLATAPPLVSKQLYLEALPLIWKTSRFYFDDPVVFKRFVEVHGTYLPVITYLGIVLGGWGRRYLSPGIRSSISVGSWRRCLNVPALAKFPTLQRLDLILLPHYALAYSNVLDSSLPPSDPLSYVISQLRQLSLRPELTRVCLKPYKADNPCFAMDDKDKKTTEDHVHSLLTRY